ncbi:transposase [Myxococcota bacterium]
MKSFQFKRTQRKYKTPYRIGNWVTYEAGLRQRGSVTLWLSEDVRQSWRFNGRRKPGGKRIYSNGAIETFRAISMIYGLALRQH